MSNKKIELTVHQQCAFDKLVNFIRNKSLQIFILKGYAGTGKTTMMKCLIEELDKRNLPCTLLASTGRAAKILSNITGRQAATVHSLIYKYSDLNQDMDKLVLERQNTGIDSTGQLLLMFNHETISTNDEIYYLVDESSMIPDKEDKNATQASFGSGRLLNDLLKYNPSGKFVFIGDTCQLPPITQHFSPALSVDYFKTTFDMDAEEFELTEVMRQEKGNDIILSAHKVRNLYHNPQPWKWAKFPFKNFKNIHILDSQTELINQYIKRAKNEGYNKTTLLSYQNKQCDQLTQILRPAFGLHKPELSQGDLLLVTQNNYISGLMNGDQVIVKDVIIKERRAGLTFLKVTVEELFTKQTYSQLLIAEILYHNQTNLSQIQQKELLIDFYLRMKEKGIKQKTREFNSMMLSDPYLNALRCVFGFALTCHKAQGGEWEYVYLDIPRNLPAAEKPYVYQWIYTAMTRASKELYVVNEFWIM